MSCCAVQEASAAAATSRPTSPDVESLEAQVGQLQSRLMFMEGEKARLISAAKSKNEQVTLAQTSARVMYMSDQVQHVRVQL